MRNVWLRCIMWWLCLGLPEYVCYVLGLVEPLAIWRTGCTLLFALRMVLWRGTTPMFFKIRAYRHFHCNNATHDPRLDKPICYFFTYVGFDLWSLLTQSFGLPLRSSIYLLHYLISYTLIKWGLFFMPLGRPEDLPLNWLLLAASSFKCQCCVIVLTKLCWSFASIFMHDVWFIYSAFLLDIDGVE
jgi:hypothetical protein